MESKSSLSSTDIKPLDVYEVLESRKFVENIFNTILQDIKNSPAYNNLKEIALQHFASIEAGENDSQHVNDSIERRKKQTYDVGYLSDCIASTLTKTVQGKVLALQDDIYAASQAVIEELETEKLGNGKKSDLKASLPKQHGSPTSYSSTSKARNKKRCIESESVSEKNKFAKYELITLTSEENNTTHLSKDVESKTLVLSNVKDTDASPSKRLSNRSKKPNSKYYFENILTSGTDYCFDETSNEA